MRETETGTETDTKRGNREVLLGAAPPSPLTLRGRDEGGYHNAVSSFSGWMAALLVELLSHLVRELTRQ